MRSTNLRGPLTRAIQDAVERETPDVRIPGNVALAAGVTTNGGGVFVCEVTKGDAWNRYNYHASLRVFRYAWPR